MANKDCIIPKDDLNTIRFWIKRELESKYLPTLPEYIEDQLFFQGRSAWTFKYTDLIVEQNKKYKLVRFSIRALLKKEFRIMTQNNCLNYRISCAYHPETGKLNILEINSIDAQLTR